MAEQQTTENNTLFDALSFMATEQYKLLRANITFTLPEDVKCPVVGILSAMRGEGKSTTALNTAYAFAESGKKTLLIDGDLRCPSVAKKMKMKSIPGLTELLFDMKTANLSDFKSKVSENLFVIPSGKLPPNPSELLASGKMKRLIESLQEYFDIIIIDLPPVTMVSDALSVALYATGVVIVTRDGYTHKKELSECVRQLKMSNMKVLGVVNNGAKDASISHYGRYKRYGRYRRYGSYYGGYGSYGHFEKKENTIENGVQSDVKISEGNSESTQE